MPLRFDVHPGVAMIKKWSDELPAKTGRSLQEWADHLEELALPGRKERVAYLKEKHELGGNTVSLIVQYAADTLTWDGDPESYLKMAVKYVDTMFSGGKAELRPIFEDLVRIVRKLGKDVKVCPCKTIVPFYRNHVFAEARPATKTRLDLALALPGTPFKGILKKNPRADDKDRLKHLVPLESREDVTPEVIGWLEKAYQADE